jgi:hypothetical protein
MRRPQFSGTETDVLAIREIAHVFDPEVRATDDIGADQVCRRTSAGAFVLVPRGTRSPWPGRSVG